jgi:hypothetical protein
MRNKWLVRGGCLFFAVAFVGTPYEAATHVGRGALCGEAFFEGRPTSYWRGRIDRWVTQYSSPEEAGEVLAACSFVRTESGFAVRTET